MKTLSKSIIILTGVLFFMANIISCDSSGKNKYKLDPNQQAKWAGCRSSHYGIKPFPTPSKWTSYVKKMSSNYKDSTGALIWIVGTVNEKRWTCNLTFPFDGTSSEKEALSNKGIRFSDEDYNEEYLTAFDKAGIDVWLQVESGRADLEELARIVMTKYKSHPCVKGFGIDVEWYNPGAYENNDGGLGESCNGYGTKLSDTVAKNVDAAVKKINPNYNIFVKHWDSKWLPKTFGSDVIFVNDSQIFGSLSEMKSDFQYWAELYYPNNVFFQIGYNADEHLWSEFDNPAKDLGAYLLYDVKDCNKCGIIWVDFTLTKVLN